MFKLCKRFFSFSNSKYFMDTSFKSNYIKTKTTLLSLTILQAPYRDYVMSSPAMESVSHI